MNENTKRISINYNINDQIIMKKSKNIVFLEIDIKELNGESVIYDNQEECSLSIVANLHNKKLINIMILALTQSGKTGTMIGLIKNYLKDTTNLIPIENIYIITGLSSRDWLDQTTKRMPKSIQDRVYHRDNLTNKFIDDIKYKKNVLIIIDEIQIAAKENQTLYKAFNEAGFYNKDNLLNNDIKIIEFTATPDGTIYDLMKWGDNALKIKMEPGEGYTSCFDLKNQNRVFQYKDLCGYNKKLGKIDHELVSSNFNDLKSHINKYKEPLYHIIRAPNGNLTNIVIDNFKKNINEDIKYYTYDKESDIKDINKILKVKPTEDTYIFIKEKLRCAKTLYKKYLGIIYERYTKSPDDAVVIQGLIGRGTGYDDNGKSIYFTNIKSIKKYEKLWESNFEDKSIRWKSKTTKRINDLLHSKGTYNNASLINGMDILDEESNEEEDIPKPIIKKSSLKEIQIWFIKNLKTKGYGNGPKTRKTNKEGYYDCITQYDKVKKVRSIDEFKNMETNNKWGFRGTTEESREKNKYRVYPCYEDINDKSTVQWWLIYY
jgi:hypothetical protein